MAEDSRSEAKTLATGEAVKTPKSSKDEVRERKRREKRKKRLLKEAEKAEKKGVCYLSRIPPKMDRLKLRQLLSPYGEIKRIYLSPEGGKKRSQFYFDIWNLKYLSKFKGDGLTKEIVCKNAVREQKLQMELSAVKKERDFYLSKVEQARALTAIQEHMKKKWKVQDGAEIDYDHPVEQRKQKMIRQFPQKQPLAKTAETPKLSKDVLSEGF